MKKFVVLLYLLVVFIAPINILAEEKCISSDTEICNKQNDNYEENNKQEIESNKLEEESENNSEDNLIPGAVSGLLMEESTGRIIFEKDKDKQVAIASMTKMVAQIIILENIESGKIKWTDIVTVSKNAADMGGSQIYLSANEKMSVKDLFKGISMASANDGTVAMAEYIAGNEEKFVKMMNKKVQELGLKNTVFKNCTGLDEEGHFSSAYDMAIIAKELLSHKDILKFSSVYEDYLRVNTPNKFWLVNTNKLVRLYDGADGLKTGHTDNAGYCLAATAKRDNMRLIAIVLGEDNAKIRNSETSALLDYGFSNKKVQTVKKSTKFIEKINFSKATKNEVKIYSDRDINILQDKSVGNKKYKLSTKLDKYQLPLKKGQIIGKVYVKEGKDTVYTGNLIVKEDVKQLKFFELYMNNLRDIILGVI